MRTSRNLGDEDIRKIVDLANKMTDGIIATGRNYAHEMAALFAEADLVWGVWPDRKARNGVRIGLLKGRPLLERLVAAGQPAGIGQAAFRYHNALEAVAACELWGDDQAEAA
ncbi:hypothetical protein [Methylorubrum extorquens]|jgi:hypothetical protein|uniref:Uncharacterized protein n=3 Tax=Methylorubrum extorquens TaxID=408 RepID=C5B004_METEA|nr:hypothetical protein [Methylorubrum extorquens]ACS41528.1 hypothetical protein MexAM1_META1p3836 [Methylorubrum extorquens AM1]MCP1540280.1 hypothetical protein [Methylorubrum extorquens]MCP1587182.1 hypothetical protein [Methylorubrum extorquens]UYW30275.1 hypothetical protein OKB92_14725 [Methylorubrum extorquens]CAX26192.1 protein of unknown function [Methylorubrum extorquens DM4]